MREPKFLARAEFSVDMVETLQEYFEKYEVDGVVSVEVTSEGLWLPNPATGSRQFLGRAKLDMAGATLH